MSNRPFIKPFSVITDGNMSGNITSDVSILQLPTVGVYTYSWSGATPVGAISIEISNDYSEGGINGKPVNAGTWTAIYFTLNGSTVTNSAPVTGNTGTGAIEFSTGAYAIRTKYTFTSGTGTLQAVICAKVA